MADRINGLDGPSGGLARLDSGRASAVAGQPCVKKFYDVGDLSL
jgi:hypothetical protein